MKRIIFIILFLISFSGKSQNFFPINAPSVFDTCNKNLHTSIRLFDLDTLHKASSFSFINQKNTILIAPLLESTVYPDIANSSYPYFISGGFAFQWKLFSKLFINSSFRTIKTGFPEYIATQYDTNIFFPTYSNILDQKNDNYLLNALFDISYQISPVFSIQAGNGKMFLGEGYRSLFLSDQGSDAPYLTMQANLNKLRYIYRLNKWQQYDFWGTRQVKYSAMHYLSWDFHKKWNLSLFETVIWKAADSIRPRGIEWTYLNPLIFFRPAEFALGSPDNMLLGGSLSYRIFPKTKIYTQILLDEFFISEMKNWAKHIVHPNDTTIPFGAWVNKQAFQIGIKSHDIFNISGLNLLSEFNFVRPYTYSHVFPNTSYSHNNQAVAHPFGANFSELLFRIEYKTMNWLFISHSFIKNTGYDSTNTHFGQNIFLSTFDSPRGNNIPVASYGNIVGQGIPVNVFHSTFEGRYRIYLSNNPIWLRFGTCYRKESIDRNTKNYFSFFAGILINMQAKEWMER